MAAQPLQRCTVSPGTAYFYLMPSLAIQTSVLCSSYATVMSLDPPPFNNTVALKGGLVRELFQGTGS